MKIIHITPGTIESEDKVHNFENHHFGAWHTKFARNTLKFTDRYEIEGWVMYDTNYFGDRGISEMESDGIVFKSFPARKWGPKYISTTMLKELKARIGRDEKILVHLQSLYDIMPWLIALKCGKVPLVSSQRGPTGPPMEMFRHFRKHPGYLIGQMMERLAARNIDFVFASSKGAYDYMLRTYGKDRVMLERGGGWDFPSEELHRPSRKELRKELGLPENHRIMIHIGKFNENKGLHWILDAFNKLKQTMDLTLVAIGGNKDQPLYQALVDAGVIVKEYSPHEEVVKYIQASDVMVLLYKSRKYQLFSGLGSAIMEASTQGVPVVSTSLTHFQGTQDERGKLGYLPKIPIDPEDLVNGIKMVLHDPERFSQAPSIAKKYFSWDIVMKNHLAKYGELFQKYYGTLLQKGMIQ